MKNKIVLILLLIFTTFLSACDFDLNFDNKITTSTLNHISTVIMNANVKISTSTYKIEFLQKIEGPYKGFGSGVIIKKEESKGSIYYYVLTNAHVIHLKDEYLHEYKIEDINNNEIEAELVTKNDEYDLAILKFRTEFELSVIELGEINPEVGDTVFSVGSPSGKQNIITAGKILAFTNIKNVEYEVIVHEAIIHSGSSGSMLINEDYELVGINTWGFIPEEDAIDESFVKGGATPIEKILEFLEANTDFAN